MRKIKILLTVLLLTQWLPSLANTFKTEHWSTAKGVKVIFYQATEVPMLDISFAFAAGSAYDQEYYGLSALTAHMLSEGSSGIDATQLADSLAETGAQFDTETSRDMVVFNLRTLTSKDTLKQATKIFTQMINHPDFPNEAIERQKQQFLMAIEQMNDSPDELATQIFFRQLYKEHPYAHPVNGTEDTIKKINKQEVVQFYKQHYLANNAILVLVGGIDTLTAHQLAEKLTHELPQGPALVPIAKALPLKEEQDTNTLFPSSQTVVRLGQSGIDYQNPDYFPLMVGNYILGGGSLVSELSMEVRGKRGLTYSIDSQFVPMPGIGPFLISFSTKNNQAKEAIQRTEETLKHFVRNGPSQQELEEAKKYLTGSFPLSLASNRAIATLLLRITFYHLPENYLNTYLGHINQVTTEEIKRAFQHTVHLDKLLLVTVGPS